MSEDTLLEQYEKELARTVDRLATYPLARLDRPDESGLTPADRVHELAQRLVDTSAALAASDARDPALAAVTDGGSTEAAASSVAVPRLRSSSSADLLAVIGRDLARDCRLVGSVPDTDRVLLAAIGWLRELRVHQL